jgi:ribosomal protein L11 methyltransferase
VAVVVDAALAELAADVLWRAGASAVAELGAEPSGDAADGTPDRRHPDPVGGLEPVELVADIDPDLVPSVEAEIAALVGRPAPMRLRAEDPSWGAAWVAAARPVRSGRFVVRPVGAPGDVHHRARPGDVVLTVDAAEAFGSGAHPSTRGCLIALDRVVRPGATVLDVGSGSGVLAVAAAAAGAERCVAVDIDLQARLATASTAARHGLGERVVVAGAEVHHADPHLGPDGADVVVANVLLPVVEAIGADLVGRTAPGGSLVVGGLLVEQEPRAVRSLAGAEPVDRVELDGWLTLVLRPTPAGPTA